MVLFYFTSILLLAAIIANDALKETDTTEDFNSIFEPKKLI